MLRRLEVNCDFRRIGTLVIYRTAKLPWNAQLLRWWLVPLAPRESQSSETPNPQTVQLQLG